MKFYRYVTDQLVVRPIDLCLEGCLVLFPLIVQKRRRIVLLLEAIAVLVGARLLCSYRIPSSFLKVTRLPPAGDPVGYLLMAITPGAAPAEFPPIAILKKLLKYPTRGECRPDILSIVAIFG